MVWEQKVFNFKGQQIEYGKGIPSNSKGLVILVHGFAEHMGRYYEFIDFLQQNGYGVYAINHLGHGKSGEAKGYINDFFQMVDSVAELVKIAKEENNNQEIVMFGHSMGGLLSIAYGIKYPGKLKGQILSAPALGVKIPKLVRIFLQVGRFIVPKIHIENKVAKDISKDKNVVDKYLKDELVLKSATVNFYYEIFIKCTDFVKNNIGRYHYPFILLHGTHDKIINYNLSAEFYDKAPVEAKEFKTYNGLYHELLNEPEKDRVKKDILKWLEKDKKAP